MLILMEPHGLLATASTVDAIKELFPVHGR